jgi:hypothetical protein
MKKLWLLTLVMIAHLAFATSVANQALLITCQTKGHLVYASCVAVTPVTAEQIAYCTTIYTAYNLCLTVLNSPLPMLPSKNHSSYSWSPYDICKYELANLAMFDLCPNTSM